MSVTKNTLTALSVIISADHDTYTFKHLRDIGNLFSKNFVSFICYDAQGDPISTGLSGSITVSAASVDGAAFQSIPSGVIDISVSLASLNFQGIVDQLKVVFSAISGCSTVKITLDRVK